MDGDQNDGGGRLDDDVLGDLLRRATSLRYSDSARAHALARAGVTLALESGSFSGEALGLLVEGQTLCQLDRFADAVEVLGDAAAQFERLGDKANEAQAVFESAEAHLYLDHVDRAIDAYQRALSLADHSELLAARTRVGIARVMQRCGIPSRAVSTLEQAIEQLEQMDDRATMAAALNALGLALAAAGEPEGARSRLEAARVMCDDERLVVLGAGCRTNLGHILIQNGQAARGSKFLDEALATFREVGHPRGTAFALFRRAELLHSQGNLADALDDVLEAIRVAEQGDVLKVPAWCHELASVICSDLGRQRQAHQHKLRYEELDRKVLPDLAEQRERALALGRELADAGDRPDRPEHDLDELEVRVRARAEALGVSLGRRGRRAWDREPNGSPDGPSRRDSLTGLPNRDHILERLHYLLDHRRPDGHLAVLFCDLLGFTSVNSSLGQQAGDELLRVFASRLEAELRPVDLAGRVGGDQFVVLLSGLTGPERAVTVAQRLRRASAQPVRVHNTEVVVTPAIGIAMAPELGNDPDALVGFAEMAMVMAKTNGSGVVRYENQDSVDNTETESAIAG